MKIINRILDPIRGGTIEIVNLHLDYFPHTSETKKVHEKCNVNYSPQII